MAAGGFCKLPDGNVVVALNLPGTPARGAGGVLPVPGSPGVVGTVAGAGTAVAGGALSGAVSAAPVVSGTVFGVPAGAMSGVPAGAVPGDGAVRVLVLAANRARALTRLRNLGMRAIYLRGNAAPPTPDEITAVLHHPDGLIWRTSPVCPAATTPELWHPIRALLRRPPTVRV
ncbi:hypothetical protein IQ62_37070 [Streptomyces scabiei]|nr:hypothetical protein IQ62_37070 [Streptomyces scabiei]